jgi:hypothetical protein
MIQPKFKVTGVYYNSKRRFRFYSNSLAQVDGVNLWRGSKWEWDEAKSKWKLLVRIYN